MRKTQHPAQDKTSHIKPLAQNATPNATLQMQQSNRRKLLQITTFLKDLVTLASHEIEPCFMGLTLLYLPNGFD